MSDREFVDTNVLLYAFDRTAGMKREIAVRLVERLWTERNGCLSLQVLQEFFVAGTKKLKLPPQDAERQLRRFAQWTVYRAQVEDVLAAVSQCVQKRTSFWDALIIESARKCGCAVLWSEDLQHGQEFEGVQIRNPFLARTSGQ